MNSVEKHVNCSFLIFNCTIRTNGGTWAIVQQVLEGRKIFLEQKLRPQADVQAVKVQLLLLHLLMTTWLIILLGAHMMQELMLLGAFSSQCYVLYVFINSWCHTYKFIKSALTGVDSAPCAHSFLLCFIYFYFFFCYSPHRSNRKRQVVI